MARSKGKSQDNSSGQRPPSDGGKYSKPRLTWVNPYLDKGDREWLSSHVEQLADVVLEFLDALPDTASVTTKMDDQSGRFLSSLVFSADDARNPSHALSMRGSTRLDSIYALAYVYDVKLKGQLSDDISSEVDGRWG